jgi:hypothetical protein
MESVLDVALLEAELEQCDRATLGDMGWLEYRAADRTTPFILSIFCFSAERRITAEAWRPEQLSRSHREGSLEHAADGQRTWWYDDSTDVSDLGQDVAKTVLGWLSACLQPAS